MVDRRFPRPEEARGPLSFVRGDITETASNTLNELVLNLPVDLNLQIGVLVRTVDFELSQAEVTFPAADASTQARTIAALSTRQELAAMPRVNTPGTIALAQTEIVLGSAVADAGVGLSITKHGFEWEFGGFGVLLATRSISLYVTGSNNKAGLTATARVMVGFHLVEIDPVDILAAISTISDVT